MYSKVKNEARILNAKKGRIISSFWDGLATKLANLVGIKGCLKYLEGDYTFTHFDPEKSCYWGEDVPQIERNEVVFGVWVPAEYIGWIED